MYSSIVHLRSAIRQTLEKGGICRIYQDTLEACWPHVPPDLRHDKIGQFAAQNHWAVTVRNLASMGLVAEFVKAADE